MHNGVIPVLELEGVELPQFTIYSNIPYTDSTVNLLGHYVFSDSYLVVHLKRHTVYAKRMARRKAVRNGAHTVILEYFNIKE